MLNQSIIDEKLFIVLNFKEHVQYDRAYAPGMSLAVSLLQL